MAENEAVFTSKWGRLRLWWGPTIGPLAWFLDLEGAFALDRHACDARSSLPLHLIGATCLIIALAGVWLTWREWKKAGAEWPGEREGVVPRSRFLAFVGLMVNLLFVVAILAQAVPKWMLDPCQ